MKRCEALKTYLLAMLILGVFIILPGCGGGGEAGGGSWYSPPVVSTPVITAYSLTGVAGIINEPAKTIAVIMPYGTDLTNLIATYTTTGTVVKAGTVVQASGTTPNNFSGPVAYTVSAADGTAATYTVNVTVATISAKAITAYSFIGFPAALGVINEPAKTIAVILPSGTNVTSLIASYTTTGTGVKVGSAVQTSGTTPNNFISPVLYTVTAADGTTAAYSVYIAFTSNAAKAITSFSFIAFPASPGVINEPAKTIAVTVPFGTDLTARIGYFTTTGTVVKIGATVQTSGTTVNNFTNPVTYTVTAADGTTASYTVTTTIAPNTAKAITAFSFIAFPSSPGVINEPAKTIAVTVPFGTDLSARIGYFTTTGKVVKIGSVVQTSGATVNNFTLPVVYTVTAADGSTATYTVTVTIAPSPAKAITAYSFIGYTAYPGSINESAKTIVVALPWGSDATHLTATFATTGTIVKIGAAVQTSTATINNFSSPLAYTVTAADSTTATYMVTVNVDSPPAPSSAKAITAYSFVGFASFPGVINEVAKTIAVTLPGGTNVTALNAAFSTTGPLVKVGAAVQTSTATLNNFTLPVVYTVTAADGSTATYTVTVTQSLAPALGAAAPYGGFGGGFGMTNQGLLTVITGDIGTTAASTLITGFHDSTGDEYTQTPLNKGNVTGRIYTDAPPPVIFTTGPFGGTAATKAIADAAAADALIAYNYLKGLPGGAFAGAGELSGLTLAPGTYTSATTFKLTLGDLTLNGGPNDIWVFQVGSALTIGSPGFPVSVILTGGAQAKNVFWQVTSAARIEDKCNMVGTIIATSGVTISTAGQLSTTKLDGRALGLTASVTMVNTLINVPAP
jgi:hypothetical protein